MRKNAFTLIEMVISIIIFSLICIYMYQAINTVSKSNDLYIKLYKVSEQTEKVKQLFYNDIFLQTDIYATSNITDKEDFSIIRFHTKNSIHSMINPYIAYFIKDETLYRIESHKHEEIPLTYANIEHVKVDKLLNDIKLFRVYEAENSYLISWQQDTKTTTFQISLPVEQKQTDNTSGF